MPAALPDNEDQRLRSLLMLNILDTGPEEEFDALAKTAAIICDVPICAISLIDADRQWFKATVGLSHLAETARDVAFCAHTICGDGLFEVEDAQLDSRFSDNALVKDNPLIRFYAGVPLRLGDGSNVGTLCVIDTVPRLLAVHQKEALQHLSRAVVKALESRVALQELIRSQSILKRYMEIITEMSHSINAAGRIVYVNSRWLQTLGYVKDEVIGRFSTEFLTEESALRAKRDVMPLFFSTGRVDKIPYQMVCKSGELIDVLITAVLEKDQDGQPVSITVIENITAIVKAQREAKNLLEAMQSQFIVAVADVNGNFIEVNDAFCRLSEYSRAELIGANENMLRSAAHPAWFYDQIEQLLQAGQSWRGDMCCHARSGKPYWIDCAVSPFYNNEGKIDRHISISIDVTEWVEQSKVIQQHSERMLLATNSGGIGVWEFDLQTRELRWEGWMYRLFGMNDAVTLGAYELWEESASGTPEREQEQVVVDYALWMNFVHVDDREGVGQALQDAVDGLSAFNIEYRVVWRDRSVHYLRSTAVVTHDSDGKAVRMVGANWDVTQLRELSVTLAENAEKLKLSEERFNLAVLGANDGLWDRNVEQGTVYYSPRWKSMLGYADDELDNAVDIWDRLIHPDDRMRVMRSVDVCVKSNIDRFSNEYRMRHKDGHYIWIMDRGLITRGERGEVTRFIGFHTDINEQKQMEKLKSEFISTVSHELRTPLTSISASLGLIEGGVVGELPPKAQNLISIAHKNSLRLTTLVNDILDMEKLLSGKVAFKTDDIDIVELISQSMVMNAEYATSYGTRYAMVAPAENCHVIGDRDRLMQVMANLMSNAAKFTAGGTEVAIRISRENDFVKVEVQDHGPGIPVEFRNRIFGEFAQANSGDTRVQGGTGLGLNITKKLVSRMGGEIGYETEVGKGSVFWFTVPRYDPAEMQELFQKNLN